MDISGEVRFYFLRWRKNCNTYNFGRGQCFIETWSKKDDTNLGFIASIRENHESIGIQALNKHAIYVG